MDRSNSFVCLKYTLISVNLVSIAIGIAGFITGLAKPDLLIQNEVSGAQLAVFSVFLLFIALIGLIGTARSEFQLLMVYGILILVSLTLRILWSLTSYWQRGETFILDANIATSIMSIIFSILIMLFAFLHAHAIRIHCPNNKIKYVSTRP